MKSKKYTIGLFIFYLLLLTWIILFKVHFSLPSGRSINLVPFGASAIINGKISYLEIIVNGLVFLPYGIFLCMLGNKKTFLKIVTPIFLTSFMYEVIQFIFHLGASDITDLIMNTLGGIVGIGFYFILHKIFKDKVCKILNILFTVVMVTLVGLIAMVLLHLTPIRYK